MKKGDPQGKCKACGKELPPYPGHGPRRNFCISSNCNAQQRVKTTNFKVTRMKYGWSKWGGRTDGILKKQFDEWFCQACGSKQPKELPAYMFPIDETKRDFWRICSNCQNITISRTIVHFFELTSIVRKKSIFSNL
jgi:hypothetical protein